MEESTEKRVWHRVRGEPELAQEVRRCLADQGCLLSAYRQTARRGGKYRLLWERKREQADCLRGLLRVMTGQSAALPQGTPGPVDLTRCFRLEQQLLGGLSRLSREEEYGGIFDLLLRSQREQCRLLLELLGGG